MLISRSGKVVMPFQYRNWYVEMTGDSDDTGGFYAFIFDPDKKNDLCYWDTSESLVYQQLERDNFKIEWTEQPL